MIRVGIPVPNINCLKAETKSSLGALDKDKFNIFYCQGSSISRMRNNMITESTKMFQNDFDFDYFLSVDSDIEFTEDNINQLIDSNKPVISGMYHYKDNKDKAVCGFFDKDGIIINNADMNSFGIHKMDWSGSGFLLIKKDVFKELEYPYFRSEVIRHEINGEIHQDVCSDDIGFFLNCKRHNVDICVNCNCKLNHIK